MNVGRGGSKKRIDIKKNKLAEELAKPIHEQNPMRIKQLKLSIKRNKKISTHIKQRKPRKKSKRNKGK